MSGTTKGPSRFEDIIGVERFKELMQRFSVQDIAKLYCQHFHEEDKKEKCKACRRTIYRAMKRVKEAETTKKGLEPMDHFRAIPEVEKFIEYERDVKEKLSWQKEVGPLMEMWTWIKESQLASISRPALWDERHIQEILKRLAQKGIATYGHKQVLRRFFESQGNKKLQSHALIRARRKDMRSKNGKGKRKARFTPEEYDHFRSCAELTFKEVLMIDIHVAVKSREGDIDRGSLLGLDWSHINWQDLTYGFETVTVDIYERKTKGGTWWRHCPVDLWRNDVGQRLKELWIQEGKPKEGSVFKTAYKDYAKLWRRLSKYQGRKLEAHDSRRSCASWLVDLGLGELALGTYNPNTGEAIGYCGVGWENAEVFYQRYGKKSPKAIYDKKLRLPTTVFSGLVLKIVENK